MGHKAKTFEEKQAIVDEVCDRISNDGISLRKATEGNMPISKSTFMDWMRLHPEFADRYARAMDDRTDVMADDILSIADDNSLDVTWDMETMKARVDGEVVGRSRLKIDTRKWLMGKLSPKKYGDKLDVTTKGKSISAPQLPPIVIRYESDNSENSSQN